MHQDIAAIVDRALAISTEPTARAVAVVIEKRLTFGQLSGLVWLGDENSFTPQQTARIQRALKRGLILGIAIEEADGVAFEPLFGTSEKKGRAVLNGLMAASDWREMRRAMF